MRSYKKTFSLILLLAFVFPLYIATAQETTSEIENNEEIEALIEQINSLLAIIAKLQAELVALAADPNTPNVGFTRDLNIGDEGTEVQGLQRILNLDARTQVAESGPGSKGQESTYYGSLTANAVSRFQELYTAEILTPVGLTRGSGFFGPSTRAKMNAIIKARVKMTVALTPKSTTIDVSDSAPNSYLPSGSFDNQKSLDLSGLSGLSADVEDKVITGNTGLGLSSPSLTYETYESFAVGGASSYAGATGESITIDGNKFTNGTKIHFGDTSVTGISSSDGKSLTFVVPNVSKGPYFLTFTSADGEDAIRVMDFSVTIENATAPEIYSISPAVGPLGTEITIYGSGFTAFNNQVEFGQHIVTGLPSPDGKSIVVNVGLDFEISTTGGGEWPVFIYLANANGRAEEPNVFIIKN